MRDSKPLPALIFSLIFSAICLTPLLAGLAHAETLELPDAFLELNQTLESKLTGKSIAARCALPPASEVKDFCEAPEKVVCDKGYDPEGKARAVLDSVQEKMNGAQTEMGIAINEASKSERRRAYWSFYNKVQIEVQERTGVSPKDIAEWVGEIKDDLTAVINELKISDKAKTAIKSKIKRVTLQNTDNVADYFATQENGQTSEFEQSCGMNGLSPGAEAHDDTGKIWVCPGLVLYYSAFARTKDELKAALLMPIAHEVGHAIDEQSLDGNPETKDLFKKMKECIDEQVGGLRTFQAHSTFNEATADFWSDRIQQHRLSKKTLSTGYLIELFRNRYRFLCSDPDTKMPLFSADSHPPGGYRIRQAARRSAWWDKIGCNKLKLPDTAPPPACNL